MQMPEAILYMQRKQRGDALVLVIVLLPILFAVLSLGVDLAGAIQMKMAQEEALGAAREASMSPSVALVAGSKEDPGQHIAEEITGSLRSFGYQGTVDVYFYELPEDTNPPFNSPPETRRVYAYQVVLSGEYQPTFAPALGIDSVPIKTTFTTCGMPYTDAAPFIWRPVWSAKSQGCWKTAEGLGFMLATFEPHTYAQMPAELQSEIGRAVDELAIFE